MRIPEKNRRMVYEYLFKEGVMVAGKRTDGIKHSQLDVPNLQVIKMMTSLKSRDYVRESFAWRHYYWFLTNEGIQYLRTYLHLPAEIVPSTLKRRTGRETTAPAGRFRPRGGFEDSSSRGAEGGGTDREYRKSGTAFGGGFGDKTADAGAGSSQSFQFRGGFGRGQGRSSEDRPRRGYGSQRDSFGGPSSGGRPGDGGFGSQSTDYHASGGGYDQQASDYYPSGGATGDYSSPPPAQGGFGAPSTEDYSRSTYTPSQQPAAGFEELWG